MNAKSIKVIFLFSLAALLALACGLTAPAANAPDEPAAPGDLSALDTQVAQTVEAARAQNTATAAVASPTSSVPLETPTPSATPEPTHTPLPSITPTLANEDPRAVLGDPDWRDPFNNGTNWTLADGETLRTDVADGFFLLTMKPANYGTWWVISWPEIENFYLETTATTPAVCSGKDRYGLFFRSPNSDTGFFVSFSCDGMFRLAKDEGKNKDAEILIDWKADPAILAGPNQTNRIGVRAVGNTIKLYANGVLIGQINDSDFTDANRFGFNIGSDSTENFTVKFDEIAYWIIE